MQTINTNLASFMSTSELRKLEHKYENPKTAIEGLILLGVQTQIDTNNGQYSKEEMLAIRDEEIDGLKDDISDLNERNDELREEIGEEIGELENNQK